MSDWVTVTNNTTSNSIFNNTKPYEQQSSLGKDDFLKILTTQLSNQDPSSPMQNQDFIAQMATFSSLEQMTNLNKSFDQFANRQMNQFAGVIGKQITWTPTDATEPKTGIVSGISQQDGNYFYLVGNEKVPIENVTEISQTASE
jgi:flagellar basal-body rod modification protein FlgD